MDKAQLERKVRLLVLSDLGSKNIGRDVPYAEIASALMIEEEQVETWVIDGELSSQILLSWLIYWMTVIRTRLLSGRLSQPTRTLHVTRSMSRSFGKEEWETVEKRLIAWRSGLQGVLEVVAAARKSAASSSARPPHTAEAVRTSQPQAA